MPASLLDNTQKKNKTYTKNCPIVYTYKNYENNKL